MNGSLVLLSHYLGMVLRRLFRTHIISSVGGDKLLSIGTYIALARHIHTHGVAVLVASIIGSQ